MSYYSTDKVWKYQFDVMCRVACEYTCRSYAVGSGDQKLAHRIVLQTILYDAIFTKKKKNKYYCERRVMNETVVSGRRTVLLIIIIKSQSYKIVAILYSSTEFDDDFSVSLFLAFWLAEEEFCFAEIVTHAIEGWKKKTTIITVKTGEFIYPLLYNTSVRFVLRPVRRFSWVEKGI